MIDGISNVRLLLERCLDGTHDQILSGPEIARKFSFERQPNLKCRQLPPSVDDDANEFCSRGLENVVRNLGVDRRGCGRRHGGMLE